MERYKDRADLFRILAHPVRLQIIARLSLKPASVSELIAQTGHRQAKISQHLAILKAAKLVKRFREDWTFLYRLEIPEIMSLFKMADKLK